LYSWQGKDIYAYLFQSAQASSGAHTASYSIGNGNSLPEVRAPGREADRATHLVQGLRMSGDIPPLAHMTSWYARNKLWLEILLYLCSLKQNLNLILKSRNTEIDVNFVLVRADVLLQL